MIRRLVLPALLLGGALAMGCGHTRNQLVMDAHGNISQRIDCRRDHPEACARRAEEVCKPLGGAHKLVAPMQLYENRWHLEVQCGAAYR